MSLRLRGTLAKIGDHRIGYSIPLLEHIGCGCLPVILVIVVISVFAASVPSCSEEPEDRSMPAVTETEELHNPYDDYDFNVYGKMKYIKTGCYGYEIADVNSAHPVTYQTGESVFVASYSPTLGWSKIQAGKNFYYVKSKNLTTSAPITETEPKPERQNPQKQTQEPTNPPKQTQTEPTKKTEPQKQTEPPKEKTATVEAKAGSNATLTVTGTPGAVYCIEVWYKTQSSAKGLEAKTADANGYVSWTWKVSPSVSAGTYTIYVYPQSERDRKVQFDFKVT